MPYRLFSVYLYTLFLCTCRIHLSLQNGFFSEELLKSNAVNGVYVLMDIEIHTYTVSVLLSVDCVASSDTHSSP